MTLDPNVSRRTVLETIPAAVVGGSLATGTASATRGDPPRERDSCGKELEVVAAHDHETADHRFELSTSEVSAGWTTIRFDNPTDHTHFAYLSKLPQAAIDDANEAGEELLDFYVEHVTRPFQWFMDNLDPETEPDPDDLSDKYSNPEEEVIFPGWFENVLPSGGAGFTSGHTTSQTTVELAPGEYIMECYVKDEAGVFHSTSGMIDHLTVRESRAGAEPEADLTLGLSTDGIDAPENVRPGQQTVAVEIQDQTIYDHLLGHDAHLIRLDHRTNLEDVNGWMNWMDPTQLVSDGSEPGTFLGGVQAIVTPGLLEGADTETAYFDVTLNPGAYAWVSEVPAPAERGMLQPFVVPFEEE